MKKTHAFEIWQETGLSLDEPVFTSGVVSRLIGIPVWVLKQLDREGIVSPQRRNHQAIRLYSLRELWLIRKCWYYLHEKKVKIPALKVILEMEFQKGSFKRSVTLWRSVGRSSI